MTFYTLEAAPPPVQSVVTPHCCRALATSALVPAQNFCQRFPHGRGPAWVGFDTFFPCLTVSPSVTADLVFLILHFMRPFRARRPGGRFPGLKPWAKILQPLRGNKLPQILLIFAPFNPGLSSSSSISSFDSKLPNCRYTLLRVQPFELERKRLLT
jgi:hypothetical protein